MLKNKKVQNKYNLLTGKGVSFWGMLFFICVKEFRSVIINRFFLFIRQKIDEVILKSL